MQLTGSLLALLAKQVVKAICVTVLFMVSFLIPFDLFDSNLGGFPLIGNIVIGFLLTLLTVAFVTNADQDQTAEMLSLIFTVHFVKHYTDKWNLEIANTCI